MFQSNFFAFMFFFCSFFYYSFRSAFPLTCRSHLFWLLVRFVLSRTISCLCFSFSSPRTLTCWVSIFMGWSSDFPAASELCRSWSSLLYLSFVSFMLFIFWEKERSDPRVLPTCWLPPTETDRGPTGACRTTRGRNRWRGPQIDPFEHLWAGNNPLKQRRTLSMWTQKWHPTCLNLFAQFFYYMETFCLLFSFCPLHIYLKQIVFVMKHADLNYYH